MQYNGRHYGYRTADDINDLVWDVLEFAKYQKVVKDGIAQNVPWPQTVSYVHAIVKAMHGVAKMRPGIRVNSWIEDASTGLVIPCRNKLLRLADLTTHDHTDAFFSLSCLPYDYDPAAGCPNWRRAVCEWMCGDQQSIELLQEWAGYLLSGSVDLQALLLLLGRKRAGKGTFVRVITALLGADAVGSLRTGQLVGGQGRFALSNNLTKSLLVFPDVRQIEPNEGKAFVQFALSITGEDDIQIDIKNQTPWCGKHPARLMMVSNEMPTLPDPSGAMDSRLLVVEFNRSFAGEEDRKLEIELKKELPGILNWALDGLARLWARGEFVQPEISAHIRDDIDDVSNPIRNFVRDCVYPDPDVRTLSEYAYSAWESYCFRTGERANTDRWFRKHLAAAMADMHPTANYRYDRIDPSTEAVRPLYLFGVGLNGFKTVKRIVAEGRRDERVLKITVVD